MPLRFADISTLYFFMIYFTFILFIFCFFFILLFNSYFFCLKLCILEYCMFSYACFRVSNKIIIVLILFYGRKISFTFAVIPTKYSIDFFFSCFLSYLLLWFILSIFLLFSRCFCFDMDTRLNVVARKVHVKHFSFNS